MICCSGERGERYSNSHYIGYEDLLVLQVIAIYMAVSALMNDLQATF
jgi:hypothetical protein